MDEEKAKWRRDFTEAVAKMGRVKFTSEDVVALVGFPPGHPSMVGAVVRELSLRGVIVMCGLRRARRVRSHRATLIEWGNARYHEPTVAAPS